MKTDSEIQVELAISQLKSIIEAAENYRHTGAIAVLKAAAAGPLERVIRLILPEIRNSISCGDGRFTSHQVHEIEHALAIARGEEISSEAA